MNLDRLKEAEAEFLMEFPGGFDDPKMEPIRKRHTVGKVTEFCHEAFRKDAFKNVAAIMEAMPKAVSRSSMVSMFEKPKLRDFVKGLGKDERAMLADALKRMLHGKGRSQRQGFETTVDLLSEEKLAKWALVTIILNSYHPDREVFVKPTTAKGIIAKFELENLVYRPRPDWAFYEEYRRQILEMKTWVDPSLAPNNAAFCGFLMMKSRNAA